MTLRARFDRESRSVASRLIGALTFAAVVFTGAAAATSMTTTQAAAQTRAPCAAHGDLAEQLGDRFDEQPVARGLASNGTVMEVFSTRDGGSWTMVVTMPNGTSCVVAAGEGWTEVLPRIAGEFS